jgi:hypothetical protein
LPRFSIFNDWSRNSTIPNSLVYLGLKLSTAPEFFERRYGPGSRVFVAGINVVMILAARRF